MTVDDIRKVTVVGAGLMGHGIALEFALGGFEVTINDADDAALDRVWERIRESARLMEEFGLIDAEQGETAMRRIQGHADLESAANGTDLVIEAMSQNLELKKSTFLGRRWAVAGPFEITDLAGLDLKQAILTELLPSLASSSEVPAILRQKVEQGDLGVKTGKGFRDWTPDRIREVKKRLAHALTSISKWAKQDP